MTVAATPFIFTISFDASGLKFVPVMVIVAPVVSDRGEKLEMEGVAAGAGVGVESTLFLQPSTISNREKIKKDNDRNNDFLNLMIIQLGGVQ